MRDHIKKENEWLVLSIWLGLLLAPVLAAGSCFAYGHWLLGLLALGGLPVWGFFVALPVVNLLFRAKGRQHRLRWRWRRPF